MLNDFTPLTQSDSYLRWQEAVGRKVIRGSNFAAIKYDLPFGLSFLYIPHGPLIRDARDWAKFEIEAKEIIRRENSIFLRFDPWPRQAEALAKAGHLRKVNSRGAAFQPQSEYIADISRDEETLFSSLRKHTRYSIRHARETGVQIKIAQGEEMAKYFDEFMRLQRQTAERGGFYLHSESYYRAIFQNCESCFLVVASLGSEALVMNLVAIHEKTAFFIFTGTSNSKRDARANYLSHWEGIAEAKRRGITVASFGGADPSNQKWQKFTSFKQEFIPGEIFTYSSSYDLVGKPFWYFLYNLRKRILG